MDAVHHARVLKALERIEYAQNLINTAAQDLCPVDGFADEWSAAGPVHQTIKDYWYRINGRLLDLERKEKS